MKKQKFFLLLISVIACHVGSSSTPDGSISSRYSSFMTRSKRADKAIQLKSVAEQIEQVVELVNGLILTEAIVENKTSINSLIIDFLIKGQMPNHSDWIADVASKEVGAKKTADFERLFRNTKPLQEILTKNLGPPFDVEVISNMANVVSALDVVHKIRTDSQNVKQVLDFFKNSAVVNLGTYQKNLKNFLEIQTIMDTLVTAAPDPNSAIDLILEAIKIPFYALGNRTSESLVNAVRIHDEIPIKPNKEKYDSKKNCVSYLKDSLVHVRVEKATAEYLVNLLNLAILSSDRETIKSVENLNDQISALHNKFSEVAKIVVSATTKVNADKLKSMLNSLASLNTTNFQEINITIRSLSPITDISRKMLNLSESNGKKVNWQNESVTARFSSYSGFPNAAFSFKSMTDNLAKKHLIPAKFLLAAIDHRSVMAQELASKIHSIAQFYDGLQLVDYVSILIDGLKNFSLTLSSSGLQNHLENMNNYTRNFPKFGSLSSVLSEMLERIETSKETHLQKRIESFSSSLPETVLTEKWYGLLANLPDFLEFMMKLREIIDNRIMDVEDYNTWNKTVVETVFEEVKKKIEMIKHGRDIASKLEKATEGQTFNDVKAELNDQKIAKIKESVLNSSLFSNWTKTNFLHSSAQIVNVSIESKKVMEDLKELASNQKPIEDLMTELSYFEPLEVFNRKLVPGQVDATKNLLKAIKTAETENFTLVDKPSEQMAMLMDGSPYGSKILTKLRTGLGAFQSLISDVSSIEDLMAHASIVKSEKPDLADRIVKLLNKVKVLEIVPPPYSKDAMQTLDKLAVTINNTEVLIQWIDSCHSLGQPKIVKELEQLKNSSNASLAISATKLHSFVSKLDKSTARQVSLLKNGLVDFEKAMSFVNCSKYPNHLQCSNGKSADEKLVLGNNATAEIDRKGQNDSKSFLGENWIWILVVCLLLLFSVIGCIVKRVRDKRKQKEQQELKKNERHEEEQRERKLAIREKKALDFEEFNDKRHRNNLDASAENKEKEEKLKVDIRRFERRKVMEKCAGRVSSIQSSEFSYLVEDFESENAGAVWCTQLSKCSFPSYEVLNTDNIKIKAKDNRAFCPDNQICPNNPVRIYEGKPLPHYNANEFNILNEELWIIAEAPVTYDKSHTLIFYDMVLKYNASIIAQVGPQFEYYFPRIIIGEGNCEKTKRKWSSKCISEKEDLIQVKEIDLDFPDLNVKKTVFLLIYNSWTHNDKPDNLEAPFEFFKKIEEIKKKNNLSDSNVVAMSQTGNGRAMLLGAIRYAQKLIDRQYRLSLGEEKYKDNPMIEKGFRVDELIQLCRNTRWNSFYLPVYYAYFEVALAKICAVNKKNLSTRCLNIVTKFYMASFQFYEEDYKNGGLKLEKTKTEIEEPNDDKTKESDADEKVEMNRDDAKEGESKNDKKELKEEAAKGKDERGQKVEGAPGKEDKTDEEKPTKKVETRDATQKKESKEEMPQVESKVNEKKVEKNEAKKRTNTGGKKKDKKDGKSAEKEITKSMSQEGGMKKEKENKSKK